MFAAFTPKQRKGRTYPPRDWTPGYGKGYSYRDEGGRSHRATPYTLALSALWMSSPAGRATYGDEAATEAAALWDAKTRLEASPWIPYGEGIEAAGEALAAENGTPSARWNLTPAVIVAALAIGLGLGLVFGAPGLAALAFVAFPRIPRVLLEDPQEEPRETPQERRSDTREALLVLTLPVLAVAVLTAVVAVAVALTGGAGVAALAVVAGTPAARRKIRRDFARGAEKVYARRFPPRPRRDPFTYVNGAHWKPGDLAAPITKPLDADWRAAHPKVTHIGRKLAAGEPITTLHQRSGLDTSLVVAVLLEVAHTGLMIAAPMGAGYVVVWILAAIRAKV